MGHYEVLGVTPDASMAEIRANYLTLAWSAHPDVQSNAEERKGAEDAMRTINAAWAVLSDVDERSVYDRERMRRARSRAACPTFAEPPVAEEVLRPVDDGDEPLFDERDDRPITPTRLPRWLVMAPPGLLVCGFGSVVLGSMVGISALVGVGIFSVVMAGLCFLLAPIVALGVSRRSDRRP
ncbi:MAG: J domain-containing protein [Acidimicrobiales bacterium]|nr:J domain-containing protein [Acidimicrobiales bacterium]MDG2218890.1 J domain-containing protein [Acidimicrobiales bacterium]